MEQREDHGQARGRTVDRPEGGQWAEQREDHRQSRGRTVDRPEVGLWMVEPRHPWAKPTCCFLGTQARPNSWHSE